MGWAIIKPNWFDLKYVALSEADAVRILAAISADPEIIKAVASALDAVKDRLGPSRIQAARCALANLLLKEV